MQQRVTWVVFVLLLAFAFSSLPVFATPEPVRYAIGGNIERIEAYAKLFERFTAETGIPVEIIATTGGVRGKWEQVTVLVAGGVPPDIVSGISADFGGFAIRGMLEPLDAYIKRDGMDMDALVPPFVQALQYDGKQYVIPYGNSALTMYYNVNHFNEAGLTPPPKTWNTDDWTFNQFVETARRLTIGDSAGEISQYGVSGYYWDSWITLPYPWGGDWVSSDLRTFRGTEAEAVASLQSLQDLVHADRVMRMSPPETAFLEGTGSMGGMGTWFVPSLRQSDVEWDFAPWFRVQGETQAAVNPIGYAILTSSRNKENAWELIKWLAWNEEANLEKAFAAGSLPSLQSNISYWVEDLRDSFGFPITPEIVVEQVWGHGANINIRMSPAFFDIDRIMRSASDQVVKNVKPADVAIQEVAGQIDNLLKQAMDR